MLLKQLQSVSIHGSRAPGAPRWGGHRRCSRELRYLQDTHGRARETDTWGIPEREGALLQEGTPELRPERHG